MRITTTHCLGAHPPACVATAKTPPSLTLGEYCKASSAEGAEQPRHFQTSVCRLFSTPFSLAHLESGLDGSLQPEGLGSSPRKLVSVRLYSEGSAAEQLPRPAALAAPRFLPLPTQEPSFLFSPLPPTPAATALPLTGGGSESRVLPPPLGARAVGGANEEARAPPGQVERTSPSMTLESPELSCGDACAATGGVDWRRRPAGQPSN